MARHAEFVSRLRSRIASRQGADPERIQISLAARDMDVPETTLRSTLEGRYPRTEEYWRKLCGYCQCSLDWLVLGLGEAPLTSTNRHSVKRILAVESDLDKLGLLRLALRGYNLEVARSVSEAVWLMMQNPYDLIVCGAVTPWSEENLRLLKRDRLRPRVLLLTETRDEEPGHPLLPLADRALGGPWRADRIKQAVAEELAMF